MEEYLSVFPRQQPEVLRAHSPAPRDYGLLTILEVTLHTAAGAVDQLMMMTITNEATS